jgi:SAM-dependent methyltransferase
VILEALGDAESVVNVGAGAGAYEPSDRRVLALEPSKVMVAQRPAGAAPVVRGAAEALPFEDDSFDAAMAVLSDHHWRRRAQGMRELRRVARRRIVLFNPDPAQAERFWLRRPRRYLDRRVRDGISVFAGLPQEEVSAAMDRLRSDLDDGSWRDRHSALLERDELDLGCALVVVELE